MFTYKKNIENSTTILNDNIILGKIIIDNSVCCKRLVIIGKQHISFVDPGICSFLKLYNGYLGLLLGYATGS